MGYCWYWLIGVVVWCQSHSCVSNEWYFTSVSALCSHEQQTDWTAKTPRLRRWALWWHATCALWTGTFYPQVSRQVHETVARTLWQEWRSPYETLQGEWFQWSNVIFVTVFYWGMSVLLVNSWSFASAGSDKTVIVQLLSEWLVSVFIAKSLYCLNKKYVKYYFGKNEKNDKNK